MRYELLTGHPHGEGVRVPDLHDVALEAVRVAAERIVRAQPGAVVLNCDERRAALRTAGESIAA